LHTPELVQYASTDVALALASALEQRCQLSRSLSGALRSQDEARLAVELYECLHSCEASSAMVTHDNMHKGTGAAAVSPAVQLVLAGEYETPELSSTDPSVCMRAHLLAEENEKLWSELHAHWTLEAQDVRVTPSHSNPGKVPPDWTTHSSESKSKSNNFLAARRPAWQGIASLQPVQECMRSPSAMKAAGVHALSSWEAHELSAIIVAWHEQAGALRLWNQNRRRQATKFYLGTCALALAIKHFIGSLITLQEKPLSHGLVCGDSIRDVVSGAFGTFFESTSNSVCKVSFHGDMEAQLVLAHTLVALRSYPTHSLQACTSLDGSCGWKKHNRAAQC